VGRSRSWKLLTGLFCLASVIFTVSFIFFLVSSIYGAHILNKSTPPALLGNKPDSIASLEKDKDNVRPFSFWVAGDPHKDDYLRMLYPYQIKPRKPSFGIIVGDVVITPLQEQHRYFWHESSLWGIDSPILMAVGNHDVSEADPIKDADRAPRAFDLNQYRSSYGPTEYSFKYAGCLFIVLDDSQGREAYMTFLKSALEKDASGARMIFVFCHIPIRPDSDHPVVPHKTIPATGFADLVKKYHVDYVISGHYHSYARETYEGTTYLVSGGGTGLGERESMLLSHGVFFIVDPAARTAIERIMVVHESVFGYIFYNIERFAALDVTPYLRSHPSLAVLYYAAGFVLTVLFLVLTIIMQKKKKTSKTPQRRT
jgi:predicted phosphodiesterase